MTCTTAHLSQCLTCIHAGTEKAPVVKDYRGIGTYCTEQALNPEAIEKWMEELPW